MKTRRGRTAAIVLVAIAATTLGGQVAATAETESRVSTRGRTPAEARNPEKILLDIDPADFDANSTTIDNPYMPLRPGTKLVYRGSDLVDGKRTPHRVVYIVTDLEKVVDGVRTLVIWDRDWSRNQLEEAELTFFAQDKADNVWHLGQYSEIYEGKELAGARGFLVGSVPGAHAGIMMQADPQVSTSSYSEGFAPAPIYWTDRARVHRVGLKVTVPAGHYANVLVTEEFSAQQSDGVQLKYYAPGVGNVLVGFKGLDPEGERLQLVEASRLDAAGLARARREAMAADERARWYTVTAPLEPPTTGTSP